MTPRTLTLPDELWTALDHALRKRIRGIELRAARRGFVPEPGRIDVSELEIRDLNLILAEIQSSTKEKAS